MQTLRELQTQLDRCGRCGACQAVCPLYLETNREPLVARGKLFLLDALAGGRLEWSRRLAEVISSCLLCRACEANCPAGVQVSTLVLAAREEMVRYRGLSVWKKAAFRYFLARCGGLNLPARLLHLYRRSGAQGMARASGVCRVLPWGLGERERLLPPVERRAFAATVPPVIEAPGARLRVGYFYGCMTNHVYHGTGRALLAVMRANGVSVAIPPQVCCGLPAWTAGDRQSARAQAERNLRWFSAAGVDRIVVDCAGCGSMLKEYGDLLGMREAGEFAGKVRDVAELLTTEVDFRPGAHQVNMRVTYHDPCHLKRYQGVADAPRQLLRALPGVELIEMEEADRCCGAAGSFSLAHPQLAEGVGSHKVRRILAAGVEAVATGCPACRLQLARGLAGAGARLPVLHTVELLSRSIPRDFHTRLTQDLPGLNPVGQSDIIP